MAIKFLNSVNADSGVLYVDAANDRVGIGTTSPGIGLDVRPIARFWHGSSSNYTQFSNGNEINTFTSAGADSVMYLQYRSGLLNVGAGTLIVQSGNGNVGIGTTSPDAKLVVSDGTNINFKVGQLSHQTVANPGVGVTFSRTTSDAPLMAMGVLEDDDLGVMSRNTIQFLTGGTNNYQYTTERMRIHADGNVSVGTTNAYARFSVKATSHNNGISVNRQADTTAAIYIGNDGGNNPVLAANNADMLFGRDLSNTFTERMRLTNSGNLGIGTTSPEARLHISADSVTQLYLERTGSITGKFRLGVAGANNNFYITDEAQSVHRLVISSSGNIQLPAYGAGYLKSDANGNITVDTSIIEDTLDSVTDRNATTTNAITVGGLTVDTDTLHVDATNNRVGIGTTSPIAALHINNFNAPQLLLDGGGDSTGDIVVPSGEILQIGHWNTSLSSYTDRFRIVQNGDVGINTTSPDQKLHVTGNVRVTGAYYDSNNSPGLSGQILSSTATGTDWVSLSEIQGVDGTGTANYLAKWSDIDTITDSVVYDDGTNVGIGTTNPSEKLHVVGNALISGGTGDATLTIEADTDNVSETDNPNILFKQDGGLVTGDIGFEGDADALFVGSLANSFYMVVDNSTPLQLGTNNAARLTINGSDGNVGIGTNSPNNRLQVRGRIGIERSNGAASSTIDMEGNFIFNAGNGYNYKFRHNGTDLVQFSQNGNVGIGETNPLVPLHISKDSASGENIALLLDNNNTTAGNEIGILFRSAVGSTNTDFEIFGVANAANDMDLVFESDGSVERMRITSAGNVGIGTTSPTATLTVVGNQLFDGTGINLKRTGVLSGRTWNFGVDSNGLSIYDVTSSAYRLTIDSSGNVGIGTTSPTHLLTLETASSPGIKIKDTTQGNTLLLFSQDSDSHVGTYSSHPLVFDTNSTERMRITSAGNVGIGTTSPSEKLHVEGGSATTALVTTPANSGVSQLRIAIDRGLQGGINIIADEDNGIAKIVTNNSSKWPLTFVVRGDDGTNERMRITSDGNVGIGTTSPSRKLHVVGGDVYVPTTSDTEGTGSFGGNSFEIRNSATGEHFNIDIYNRTSSAWYTPFHIQNTGNVGIGTTNPSHKLHIESGVLKIQGTSSVDGTAIFVAAAAKGTQQSHIHYGSDGDWYIRSASTSGKIVIQDNGGNVGIGTASPAGKLHSYISESRQMGHNAVGGDLGVISDNNSAPVLYVKGTGTADLVNVLDGTTNVFTIKDGGNVGIGTTSPGSRLQVKDSQDSSFDSGIGIIRSNSTQTGYINMVGGAMNINAPSGIPIKLRDGGATNVTISGDGNVGIGTTSPVAKLDVNGATRIGGKTTYTKGYASLSTTGNAVAGLGTSGNGASARLVFEMHGGAGEYQRVVYACYNASGNWYPTKVIDEGTNAFDVTDSGNGTTVTFTFKARTASQAYSPYVTIEHVGAAIDTSYL